MAAKKKSSTGKKRVVRHEAPVKSAESSGSSTKARPLEKEKPRLPERLKEKDSGLGVLKAVGFVIIALVLVSTVLFNRSGGRDSLRGDKLPGESCEETVECQKGSVCYFYKDSKRHCMETCSKNRPCGPGYTCVTAASQKRRKGIRVTDVCVEDAKI